MASRSWPVKDRRVLIPLLGFLFLIAPPADALRVVDYNILNYPGSTGSARAIHYRTVLGPLKADVLVTEEMSSPAGPNQFLSEVLNAMEPGQWATVPFVDGNDTDSSLFYKPAKVQFIEQSSFYPNPSNPLRLVHVYRLQPVGYASAAAELRIYSGHLKASTGYEVQRLAECQGIREHMNAMPEGTHAMICGDLNFYRESTEPGYAKLLESQANNVGRVYDLLPAGDWHDNGAFAAFHTQSPCLSGACASGAATGGMDDRFDFILPTWNLGTAQGLAVLSGTCFAVGNDGQHLNKNITDPPTIPEGSDYATALQLASDHLPLRVDLQLPAEIVTDPALAFGPVIIGAPAQSKLLTLENPAVAPADSLNCVFSATEGFAPPGPVAVAAGGSGLAAVTLVTATSGVKSGTLTVWSDAPDDPTTLVDLSGTVLDHAAASLDSIETTLSGVVDFGDHEMGFFTERVLRVYNLGYDPLHARLSIDSGVIAGGDGRFSLVGGFTGSLIGNVPAEYTVAFDDANAVTDSTYLATLTFCSSDETLPGALQQPDLVVSLRAQVLSGQIDVAEAAAPKMTRLYDPSPNPATEGVMFRLDLARTTEACLAVFDPSGRRVTTLRQGVFAPARYEMTWDGLGEDGTPVGSGIYFIRFGGAGTRPLTARLVIVR